MLKNVVFFLPGLLFGAGLAISGMTNPAKVANFLDVAGQWDGSLMLVMVGAIGAFGLLNWLIHKREKPVLGGEFPGPRSKDKVDRRLVLGAIAFGVGWGLSGVCPGPALTDLSTLRPDVFVYVGGMVAGMVIAQRVFGADAPKTKPAEECESDAEPTPA